MNSSSSLLFSFNISGSTTIALHKFQILESKLLHIINSKRILPEQMVFLTVTVIFLGMLTTHPLMKRMYSKAVEY